MEWYEELGFFENPFEVNLFKSDYKPLGLEEEKAEALYRVASGSMMLIEGESGSGKTAILKHIIDNFKGKGKLIYVNAKKLNKGLDVEKLLINSYGIKGKIFKKKPKGMILLLDNVSSISKNNASKIKYYFDQDHLYSVVFTTRDLSASELDDSIKDRIEKRIIKLKSLNKSQLTELIKNRIGDKKVFDDEIIDTIVKESESPINALVNAARVAEYIADKGDKGANKEKVKQIISNVKGKPEDDNDDVYNCLNCGKKMKNVGDYWRCQDCEDFCDKCGSDIEDDDEVCPVCGTQLDD